MDDRQLVDWPRQHEAADIRARLRRVRPIAELLYTWGGKWILGEVRPNWLRYKTAVSLFEQWEFRKTQIDVATDQDLDEHRAYWRDCWLGLQGFVFIREYNHPPDGRIVLDYERMCWKEDRGLLKADWDASVSESTDGRLKRKIEHIKNYTRQTAGDIHRHVFRKPHSVVGTNPERWH